MHKSVIYQGEGIRQGEDSRREGAGRHQEGAPHQPGDIRHGEGDNRQLQVQYMRALKGEGRGGRRRSSDR